MASVRRRGERIRVDLEAEETTVLLALVAEVLDVLSDDDLPPAPQLPAGDEPSMDSLLAAATAVVEEPTDPVLARLLPAAYRDDDQAAGEFRRLTDSELRATKRAALTQIATDITNAAADQGKDAQAQRTRLTLERADAVSWLRALTDVRLTFGTRMGVTEDMTEQRAGAPPGSAQEAEFAIYDWLAWLQEVLVDAVAGR